MAPILCRKLRLLDRVAQYLPRSLLAGKEPVRGLNQLLRCLTTTRWQKTGPAKAFHSSPKKMKHAQYGGRFMVTMLPGDGIGPEMMNHVKDLFKVGGVPVDFEEVYLDTSHDNQDYMDEAIVSIKRNGVALKGNIETRDNDPNFKSRNVELRLRLDLFANVIHCKSQPSIKTRHSGIDIILIRQNTEGEYSCMEHENVKGVVESLKIITKSKSEEIARYAFNYAVEHGRRKVTAVHKANIMKMSDGLFLQTCSSVAKEFPNIEFDNMIIDNCSMQLVSNPTQFDVLLLPNLYGNILTNIACGLIGGPGLASGINIGSKYAVFETGTRNTGKSVVGMNVANPLSMFSASADMLEYLGLTDFSTTIRKTLAKAIDKPELHTPDLGGNATTGSVVDFVLRDVKAQMIA